MQRFLQRGTVQARIAAGSVEQGRDDTSLQNAFPVEQLGPDSQPELAVVLAPCVTRDAEEGQERVVDQRRASHAVKAALTG
jgi:hypothetical protein